MVRSAESVAFNIVEGCAARHQKDFARFLDVSIKSANELQSQLELARDARLLGRAEWERLTTETVEIRRMIWGLRRRILVDLAASNRS
jgi:four helix bundle protein